MDIVDLHVHSNKSDGSFTPAGLVDYAVEKGLKAFALTDHDTTEGLDEALDAAKGTTVEVIPGIEFSTEYEGKDIHIVGLYIDHKCSAFRERIQAFVDSRIERNRKMCANLQGAGIDISYEKLLAAFPGTYEDLLAEFPDAVITRAHYAKYLMDQGAVKNMPEAFDKYVGDHTRYFVPREKVTPMQAVQLILKAGGIPVLAHPTLYHMSDKRLGLLLYRLKGAGLAAMECIYSTYSPSEERQMKKLAAQYGLLPSGGSDFHGDTKPKLDLGVGYGNLQVPVEILTNLKKWLQEYRS